VGGAATSVSGWPCSPLVRANSSSGDSTSRFRPEIAKYRMDRRAEAQAGALAERVSRVDFYRHVGANLDSSHAALETRVSGPGSAGPAGG
jgi:hypothetical protein